MQCGGTVSEEGNPYVRGARCPVHCEGEAEAGRTLTVPPKGMGRRRICPGKKRAASPARARGRLTASHEILFCETNWQENQCSATPTARSNAISLGERMPAFQADSAAELCRYIANGADPVEIAEAALERIDANGGSEFICTLPKRARREAEASLKRQRAGARAGPLDGVPLAWKDLIDLEGTVTTCASKTRVDHPPAMEDAVMARNAAAAGLVSIGKTNLTEFAFSGIGLNPHWGTPSNPFGSDCPRVPGGSSSGSAVAVANGLVPAAIGTDTGGSVRIPACFNGLAGLKTSEGRISLKGVAPLAPSFDTAGPICRTVEDCALVDAALRGVTPSNEERPPLSGVIFFAPDNVHSDNLEEAVAANFEAALRALRNAGADVQHGNARFLDSYAESFSDHSMLTASEAYGTWRHVLEGPKAGCMDARVRDRMMAGMDLLPRLGEIRERRRREIAAFQSELGRRVLATPTVAHVAPARAALEADPELHREINLRTLRLTMPGNWLRCCGLTLPNGRDGNGLPTGLLLTLPWGEDDRLLAVGQAVENVIQECAGFR